MKILHYIENGNDQMSVAVKFIAMLQQELSPLVDMKIVTGKPSRRQFLSVLYDFNPDIVHIHECWSLRAALIQQWSQSRSYPVVISPHGKLMNNVIQTKFWKHKLPRIVGYQFRSIKKSYLLIASTSKELKSLKELGWRKRIAFVRNPFATDTVSATPKESATNIRQLYQKIIDTEKYLKMTPLEEHIFSLLLTSSVMQRGGINPQKSPELIPFLTEEIKTTLQHLSALQWNNILLAAHDRGILENVIAGAKALEITLPFETVTPPIRFSHKLRIKIRMNTNHEEFLKNNFPQASENEKDIILIISRIYRHTMKKECQSDKYRVWRDLTELTYLLRFADYDESLLARVFKKTSLKKFASRLFAVLSETHLLSEGFTPSKTINDNKTGNIRKRLYLQP